MLKVAPPLVESKIKCGEVFYALPNVFQIGCTECGMKFVFDEFVEHFRKAHLVHNETLISLEPIKIEEPEDNANCDGFDGSSTVERIFTRNFWDDHAYTLKVHKECPSALNNDAESNKNLDDSDLLDDQDSVFFEDGQEYIDSIEQIVVAEDVEERYIEHYQHEGAFSDSEKSQSASEKSETDTADEIEDDKNSEKADEEEEEEMEYVLFEEEIEPANIIEAFESEKEAKDHVKNTKSKIKFKDKQRQIEVGHGIGSENENNSENESNKANGKNGFECQVCHHILNSKFNLKYHMEYVHAPRTDVKVVTRKFQCRYCEVNCPTSFELSVHKRKFHSFIYVKNNQQNISDAENDVNRPVPCTMCPRRFRNESSLSTHMRVHNVPKAPVREKSSDQLITCEFCNKKCRSMRFLYVHQLRYHSSTYCQACNCEFKNPIDAYRHKLTHRRAQAYLCDYCDISCYTLNGLEQHMQDHKEKGDQPRPKFETDPITAADSLNKAESGSGPFICEVCGQMLRNVTALKYHMQRHKNERPFKCDVCGKCFFSNSYLKSHKLIHSGERPFFCSVCGATFQYKRALKTHFILHSEKRDFKCNFCDKAYVEAARLKYHVRLKHACEIHLPIPLPKRKTVSVAVKPDGEVQRATKALEQLNSIQDESVTDVQI